MSRSHFYIETNWGELAERYPNEPQDLSASLSEFLDIQAEIGVELVTMDMSSGLKFVFRRVEGPPHFASHPLAAPEAAPATLPTVNPGPSVPTIGAFVTSAPPPPALEVIAPPPPTEPAGKKPKGS